MEQSSEKTIENHCAVFAFRDEETKRKTRINTEWRAYHGEIYFLKVSSLGDEVPASLRRTNEDEMAAMRSPARNSKTQRSGGGIARIPLISATLYVCAFIFSRTTCPLRPPLFQIFAFAWLYIHIYIYIRWNWKGTLAASFQKKMWYALFLLAKILRGKRKEREKKKGEVEAFGCFPRSSSEYFISQFRLRSFGHSRPTCTSLRLNET